MKITIVLDVADLDEMSRCAADLLAVVGRQIDGAKRYELGTLAHRRATAAFDDFHAVDRSMVLEDPYPEE